MNEQLLSEDWLRDWFVGYMDLNTGKVRHACVTALAASDAKKSFEAYHRHHKYLILCCFEYDERTAEQWDKMF